MVCSVGNNYPKSSMLKIEEFAVVFVVDAPAPVSDDVVRKAYPGHGKSRHLL